MVANDNLEIFESGRSMNNDRGSMPFTFLYSYEYVFRIGPCHDWVKSQSFDYYYE